MSSTAKTPQRILDTSRRLFNEKGYAATTLTEIASAIGISQGNLTYHFPTKRHLLERLREEARTRTQTRRAAAQPGNIADDYVEHLLFAMELTWTNRFLLRDQAQFTTADDEVPNPGMTADLEELRDLLERTHAEGLFRKDLSIDIDTLTRSLWLVSRYWMDHLRELEGLSATTWADQERGIKHHFAVLLPCLTAPARRMFEAALTHANDTALKN